MIHSSNETIEEDIVTEFKLLAIFCPTSFNVISLGLIELIWSYNHIIVTTVPYAQRVDATSLPILSSHHLPPFHTVMHNVYLYGPKHHTYKIK